MDEPQTTTDAAQTERPQLPPELLEKKRELVALARVKAAEARKEKAEARKEAEKAKKLEEALERVETKKKVKELETKIKETAASVKPAPIYEDSEEEEAPVAVSKKSLKKTAKPVKVYVSASEESSDDDEMILVKKRTLKKWKKGEGKATTAPVPVPPRPASPIHELSERALRDRWHQERYKAMFDSVFP